MLAVAACIAQVRRPVEGTIRQPMHGKDIAVAAGSDYATEAGMQIRDLGGNAVDVGVGTMFAAVKTTHGLGNSAALPSLARSSGVTGVGPSKAR